VRKVSQIVLLLVDPSESGVRPGGMAIRRLMVAPGLGPVGFGIAMVAAGGVLVGNGHDLAGGLLDLFGVVSIWAGFRTYRGD
jgi:hypothetical protein